MRREGMKIKTRYFGEIELDDAKVITFDKGLFGFEEFTRFALLYDSETGESTRSSGCNAWMTRLWLCPL